MDFLETFESLLEQSKMLSHVSLWNQIFHFSEKQNIQVPPVGPAGTGINLTFFLCRIVQLRMLNFASAAKARSRTVTLTRPSRDEVLHFAILGGFERGFGIFIARVEKGSKAEEVGLKRGDQILEVNGQSFEHVAHSKALDILRSTTHLSITVRSNLHGFKGKRLV